MMTTEVMRAALPTTSKRDDWTEDEAAAIEAAGLTFTFPDYHERRGETILAPRPIIQRFLHTCATTGLDPLARQIYCIARLGKNGIEWTTQTGIDGFRVIAERSRKYAGQDPAEWLTADGQWTEVWIREVHGQRTADGKVDQNAHPLAARVRVYRHDWREDKPAVGVATWDEYVQLTSTGNITSMWRGRGPGQLAKCAEALALRKGFPQDLAGLYTDDEMGQASNPEREAEPEDGGRPKLKSRVAGAQRHSESPEDVPGRVTPADDENAGESNVVPVEGDYVAGGIVPEDPSRVTAFECARCGRVEAPEEGMICPSCEAEVEAEIAAEEAALEEPPTEAAPKRGTKRGTKR
jgi:phage recombination protein Bet